MSNLEKNRVFTAQSQQSLKTAAVRLMDTADTVSKALETEKAKLEALYREIPSDCRYTPLGNSLSEVPGSLSDPLYGQVSTQFSATLDKLTTQIPAVDETCANAIKELTPATAAVTFMISELETMLYQGILDAPMEKFAATIGSCQNQWENTAYVEQQIQMAETILKGIPDFTRMYGDPVNMSTGNFIHEYTDLTVNTPLPLSFTRFYNAMDRRKGILGRGWVHNYEQHLDLRKTDKIIRITEQGTEETYRLSEDGTYRHFWQDSRSIRKQEENYLLIQENTALLYDQTGNLRSITEKHKGSIAFSYNEKNQLQKAYCTTGEALTYTYSPEGQLETVTDHTGRCVHFTCQSRKLHTVTTPMDQTITYEYGDNNRISQIKNEKNIIRLENEYDQYKRITRQTFPDGGQIKYTYLDTLGAIRVTEPNGNQITYYHDEKMRSSKTVYENGQETYTYDDRNNLLSQQDKNGNQTTYTYDTQGHLLEQTDPLGGKTTHTYDPEGRLTATRYPDGGEIVKQYDPHGRPRLIKNQTGHLTAFTYEEDQTTITLPDQSTIKLQYDNRHNITSMETPAGRRTHYEYDPLNRVSATIDGQGRRTTYERTASDRISAITRPDGAVRTYEYEETGNITAITDYDGHQERFRYNDMGKPITHTDKNQNTRHYQYDLMQNIIKETDPLGGETTYRYNPQNLLEAMVDSMGTETTYTYDPSGNCTQSSIVGGRSAAFTYDALNRITAATLSQEGEEKTETIYFTYDPMGNLIKVAGQNGTTTYTYDKQGRKITETHSGGIRTHYTYTPLGKVETITDRTGSTTTYTYHPGGLLQEIAHPGQTKEHFTYDPYGRIESYRSKEGEIFRYRYDCLDRITAIRKEDGEATLTYDTMGNIVTMLDFNRNQTRYEYSPTGNLVKVTDAMGTEIEYTYDKRDNLIGISQTGTGNTGEKEIRQLLSFGRNPLGQIETITNALGQQERYTYDVNGNTTSKTDRQGRVTHYGYDVTGMLCQTAYPDGQSVTYTYDPLTDLYQVTDWLGTMEIQAHEKGHISKVTDYQGQETRYEWGDREKLRTITYPDGYQVTYDYDEALRVTKVTDGTVTARYAYDPHGRLKEKTVGDRLHTLYGYHPSGKLASLRHQNGEDLLESYEYRYDPMGNPVTIIKERKDRREETGTYSYTYDALGRILSAEKDGHPERSYQYDPYGNRTQMREYLPIKTGIQEAAVREIPTKEILPQETGPRETVIEQTTTYQYNLLNQLTASACGETASRYTYDPSGNLLSVMEKTGDREETIRYGYNAQNRVTAEYQGGEQTTHTYDGLGRRVESHVPEGTTRYAYDLLGPMGSLLLQERNGQVQRFLWDSNPLAITETKTGGYQDTYYYLQDERNSPLRLLTGEGRSVGITGYDEYGVERGDSQEREPFLQPFGYTGYRKEKPKDTYYANARTYHARSGRFQGEDSLSYIKETLPQSFNLYQYCQGNPMKYTDPLGHDVLEAGKGMPGIMDENLLIVFAFLGVGAASMKGAADTGKRMANSYIYSYLSGIGLSIVKSLGSAWNGIVDGSMVTPDAWKGIEGFGRKEDNKWRLPLIDVEGIERSFYMDAANKQAFYAGAMTMDWLVVILTAASIAQGLSGAGSAGGGGFGGKMVTPDGMTIGALAPAVSGELALTVELEAGIAAAGAANGMDNWDKFKSASGSEGSSKPTSIMDETFEGNGRYSGKLEKVNNPDVNADKLADRIGGESRVKFSNDSAAREFDAISNEYIAQAKPPLKTVNKTVRTQMKATFEAAVETGKKVYYQFEGKPDQSVINKLMEYSQRYGVEVIIDINPLN